MSYPCTTKDGGDWPLWPYSISRFLWHQPPGAHTLPFSSLPSVPDRSREREHRGIFRKQEGEVDVAGSHGQERSEPWTRSGKAEMSFSLRTAAKLALRNTSSVRLAASWKIKKLAARSSDSSLEQPVSQNLHSIQKGEKETQAGCKLFESFVRRGIFPVKYFFSFLEFVSKQRERERSHEP